MGTWAYPPAVFGLAGVSKPLVLLIKGTGVGLFCPEVSTSG